uniref:DCN1-like protein 5 n=1 Tax=Erigeron canadensis TaxID=72917 RepID=UPI001CB8FB14|nr:DCN1-like protein 5 [Erigeron canadensis]
MGRRNSNKNKKPPSPPTSSYSKPSSSSFSFTQAQAPVKVPSKEECIDNLYNSYATSSMIGPEGIERLSSDLGIDYTDVRMLMLAWKMQAEKQGFFTLEEWRRGLKALQADTIIKLQQALPELENEVQKPANHLNFYTYAFEYCLTEDRQKSIDVECICQLLELVLGSKFHHQVKSFVRYLKTQVDYKVINTDQWTAFYRFCNEISFPDLKNYDDTLAWPLIVDDYVEWMKSTKT